MFVSETLTLQNDNLRPYEPKLQKVLSSPMSSSYQLFVCCFDRHLVIVQSLSLW